MNDRARDAGEAGRAAARARTGRRPGNADTRASIVDAAGHAFAHAGFNKATMRDIAARAGVDPALIHHYFGTKKDLFLAAVRLPIDPAVIVARVLDGDVKTLGRRIVSEVVSAWDSPLRTPLMAALRAALADPERSRGLREFLVGHVIGAIVGTLNLPRAEAELRASLVASQMAGLMVTRYVLALPPLATASAEQVVDAVGPVIQHYLTGDLAGDLRLT